MRNKSLIDTNNKAVNLIYPEMSYTIMGILFEVHNKLGTKYQEKHYQRAITTKLKTTSLIHKREVEIPIKFEGESLGKFYIDFVIEDKIILEIKTANYITNDMVRQVLRYLENTGLRLAIIANFRQTPLEYRRIVF